MFGRHPAGLLVRRMAVPVFSWQERNYTKGGPRTAGAWRLLRETPYALRFGNNHRAAYCSVVHATEAAAVTVYMRSPCRRFYRGTARENCAISPMRRVSADRLIIDFVGAFGWVLSIRSPVTVALPSPRSRRVGCHSVVIGHLILGRS